MRTATTSLTLIAALLCSVASPVQAEIAWEKSLRKAHSRASQENKLILLHFVRDNCVYCDKLEAGAFQSADVERKIKQGFVPLKINVSDSKGNRKLAEMFKVDRFPMDVVVTTDGVAKAHGVSPQQPDRYVRMLAKTQSPNAPNLNQPGSRTPLPNRNAAPTQQIASAGPTNQVPANQASYAKPGYALPQSTTPAMNRRPAMNQQAVNQQAMNQQAMNQQQATMTPPAAMNQPPAVAVPPRNPAPQNKLASARMQNNTAGMTLSMPEQVTESAPPSRPTGTSSGDQPTLAMEGFCSVSVINESRWVEGKPDFGVVHLGKLYLFASEAAMKEFLANPMPYTPVLNEIDVVRFFEDRAIVSGSREWAVTDPSHKRMFFFADEAAMIHFQNEYARYVDAAIEVMDKAVSDANPGS